MQSTISEISVQLANAEFSANLPVSAQILSAFPSPVFGFANIAVLFDTNDVNNTKLRNFLLMESGMSFAVEGNPSYKLISPITTAEGRHFFLFELVGPTLVITA